MKQQILLNVQPKKMEPSKPFNIDLSHQITHHLSLVEFEVAEGAFLEKASKVFNLLWITS